MKKTLVCGAGGLIGAHMVKKLNDEGFWVRGPSEWGFYGAWEGEPTWESPDGELWRLTVDDDGVLTTEPVES